jgi:Domain of unknown function (DUF4388)
MDLSGSVSSLGLPALLRLVARSGRTGRLRIWQDRWAGEVGVASGRVVRAAIGTESGRAALEVMALALPEAHFAFQAGSDPGAPNLDGDQHALDELFAALPLDATCGLATPVLATVPRVVVPAEQPTGTVVLDRRSLDLLHRIDGRHTAEQLGAQVRLVDVVRGLIKLRQLGLVVLESPPGAPPAPAAAAPPDRGRPVGRLVRPVPAWAAPLAVLVLVVGGLAIAFTALDRPTPAAPEAPGHPSDPRGSGSGSQRDPEIALGPPSQPTLGGRSGVPSLGTPRAGRSTSASPSATAWTSTSTPPGAAGSSSRQRSTSGPSGRPSCCGRNGSTSSWATCRRSASPPPPAPVSRARP